MKKREIFLLSSLTFSLGIILGFLLSPARNGFGNNAGNNIHNYYCKKHSATDESHESQCSSKVSQG